MDDNDWNSRFLEACRRGASREEIHALATNSRVNVNVVTLDSARQPALHMAVSHASCNTHHLPLLRYLLSIPSMRVNASNAWGETALHLACASGSCPVTACLLDHADVQWNPLSWQGRTPLQAAVGRNHVAVVQLFLEKYVAMAADVSWLIQPSRRHGNTALHTACRHGCRDMVLALVDGWPFPGRQWDLTQRNHQGQTARHVAATLDIVALVDALSCRQQAHALLLLFRQQQQTRDPPCPNQSSSNHHHHLVMEIVAEWLEVHAQSILGGTIHQKNNTRRTVAVTTT